MAKTSASSGAASEDARLAEIGKALASDKRVTSGRLFASQGLQVDGKIFAMIVKGRLVVKLPKARVDELAASGSAERFDPGHGRLMKEWAVFAGSEASWTDLAREACAYVGGLQAAAGRRKKAAGSSTVG